MAMDPNVIKQLIEGALPGAHVEIRDLVGDQNHFEALVIHGSFQGKSLIDQHQAVMAPLREVLKEDLHALAIKTFTPERWQKAQGG